MTVPADPSFRLLFVCTGNTCRSPLAEVIARRRAVELGWQSFHVGSAGVAAFPGGAASGGSQRAAAAHGLDLADHRSSQLTPELVADAELILTMSSAHAYRVAELGGGDRVAVLTAFAAGSESAVDGPSVPDPVGGPDEEYLETYRALDDLIERALERIAPAVAP